MKGIIFVLHGRKNKLSSANLSAVEQAAEKLTIPYEIGLLEGAFQTLEQAVEALQLKKVTEIVFLPVLLFPATHAKDDLPERANQMLKDQIPYRILPTLGMTEAIKQFLLEQVQQANLSEAEVLLIAHGTPHYLEPFQQLKDLAEELAKQLNRSVHPASYFGDYNYHDVLEELDSPLIIQRLFLTEGYIAKKIKNEIVELRGTQDLFLPTLQDSEALVSAIVERLEEV